MNKHQIKGAAKEVVGKVRKNVGIVTANGSEALAGAKTEIAGKVQKAYGNAKSSVKRDIKREERTSRDRDIERRAH